MAKTAMFRRIEEYREKTNRNSSGSICRRPASRSVSRRSYHWPKTTDDVDWEHVLSVLEKIDCIHNPVLIYEFEMLVREKIESQGK